MRNFSNLPNLLIVDDNTENLKYLEIILKGLNVNLIKAESAFDALGKTKGVELALAILDIHMPGMDGYQLALKINEERYSNNVPIIFVTANYIDEMDVFQGYISGAVDYIIKPINSHILQSKVNVFIDLFNQKQTILRDSVLLKKSADELTNANNALKNSEQRFRGIYENTLIGLYQTTPDGRILVANLTLVQMLGFSSYEELAQRNLRKEGFDPTSRRLVFQKKNEQDGQVLNLESVWIRQDGTKLYVNESAKAVYDESGNILYYDGIIQDITKQIQTENERKKSEVKYRTLFETMIHGVVHHDEDGRIISANPAAERILGLSFDQMKGLTSIDPAGRSIHEDGTDFPGEAHPAMVALRTGKPLNNVIMGVFNPKVKENRWINISATPLFFEGENKPYQVYSTFEDITKRMNVEKTLAQKNDELFKLNRFSIELSTLSKEDNLELFVNKRIKEFVQSNVAIFSEYNSEKRTLTVKHIELAPGMPEKAVRLIGKEVKNIHSVVSDEIYREMTHEIIGIRRTLYDMTFGAIPRPVAASIKALLKADRFLAVAYVIEGKLFGTSMFAMSKDQPDPPKRILENFIFLAALSFQRKQAEETLIVSEEKYKTLLNASPDGILLIDLNGIISEVSEIGIEIFGAETRDDLVDKNILLFIPSDEKNTIREIIGKTMNEGLVQNIGIKMRKKDQSLFAAEVSATLIQNMAGMPLSFMVIIRNISHRKEMETKQMHADRMANLGEMAAGIAHEINQPLNIISLVMDKILFMTAKTEAIDIEFLKEKSDIIFQNISRMRNIIDHIRTFSRSRDDYVLTAFDINLSIGNAISMITEEFKYLGINLNLQLEKQILPIFGNNYKFEQVILNLLVNAKDAVIEKKSKQEEYFEMIIGIRTYQENQYLIVEVTDNGIGISIEDINNIMLPFYTTKDEGKGTGLGLSISYQIIKEMNGTIDIVSDRVNGTKIKLALDISKN